jgi:DNA-binding MarR family transcriptional regulator
MRMATGAANVEMVDADLPGPRDARSRANADASIVDAPGVPEAAGNPLDKVIGYRLRRAQLVTFQEFIDFFARVKLRPAEYALISVLERRPGLSQTDAANMLGIKRANFVSLLDSLERRGLAERRAVHGDRRSRALHLTERGHALAEKAEHIATAYDDMLVARLGGPEERDLFLDMLDRLVVRD